MQPSKKDEKHVKQPVQLSRTLSVGLSNLQIARPTPVLPGRVPGSATASVASVASASKMVDEPTTPPSPPTPPSNDVKSLISADSIAKCDLGWIAKLDPKNPDHRKIAEQTAAFLLGARNGLAGDLKHLIDQCNNVGLYATTNMKAGTGVSTNLNAFNSGTYSGSALNWYIPAGNTPFTRIGRVVKLKHLTLRMNINWSQSTDVTNIRWYLEYMAPLRITIVRDKMQVAQYTSGGSTINFDASAALAIISDQSLWYNPGTSLYPQGACATWTYNTHGFRYEVLHDEVINPPANASAIWNSGLNWATAAQKVIERHIKVDGIRCEFADDNTGAPPPSLLTNGIYIMFAIDASVYTGAGTAAIWPVIDVVQDLSFVDA